MKRNKDRLNVYILGNRVQAKVAPDLEDDERYSAFSCRGNHWYEVNNKCRPHCRFVNLCLNTTDQEWVYFRRPERVTDQLMYDGDGRGLFTFPTCFTQVGHPDWEQFGYPSHCFSPEVRFGPVPSNSVWSKRGVSILYLNPYPIFGNFGHLWFGLLAAYSSLLEMFGFLDWDAQIIQPSASGKEWKDQDANMIERWIPALSTSPVVPLPDVQRTLGRHDTDLVCFPNILVGDNCLNPGWEGNSYPNPKYSLAARKRISRITQRRDIQQPNAPHITLVKKAGIRLPINYDAIDNMLFELGSKLNVTTSILDLTTGHPPSAVEQVVAIEKTTLLLQPAGGIVAGAIFLPPGATSLTFGIWRPTITPHVWDYDHSNLKHFSHISNKIVPVLKEDYDRAQSLEACHKETRDRDQNHLKMSPYIYCSYIMDIERLRSMVQLELDLWWDIHRADGRLVNAEGKLS
eukprot:scaffold470_cov194-Amphora_coffeaeformis.AAC.2